VDSRYTLPLCMICTGLVKVSQDVDCALDEFSKAIFTLALLHSHCKWDSSAISTGFFHLPSFVLDDLTSDCNSESLIKSDAAFVLWKYPRRDRIGPKPGFLLPCPLAVATIPQPLPCSRRFRVSGRGVLKWGVPGFPGS